MRRSYGTLLWILAPAAFGAYQTLLHLDLGPQMSSADTQGLIAFIALAFLAEWTAVDFRLLSGQNANSSLAFLPFIGCIVLFPPVVSVATVGGVVLASQFVFRRHTPTRAATNCALASLGTALAAFTYHMLHTGTATDITILPVFIIASTVFFASNVLLATAALAFLHRSPFGTMFRRVTGPNASNLTYDLLASPIALVLVLLYAASPVLGPVVILLPLVLLSYSYRSKKEAVDANKDLLRALVKAIETRDPYTEGHSVRVATLAQLVAQDIGLRFRRLEQVETSALLHDIGKVDPAYSAVIAKPHDLTQEERDLIQTHAARGAELLQTTLSSMQPDVIAAVLHHHERYDGAGYPHGLAGEQIPLAARIIMLCDSVDAMLSDRPYRRALSIEHVRSELMKHSGTQFDPAIVAAVLQKNTLERAVDLIRQDTTTQRSRVAVMN